MIFSKTYKNVIFKHAVRRELRVSVGLLVLVLVLAVGHGLDLGERVLGGAGDGEDDAEVRFEVLVLRGGDRGQVELRPQVEPWRESGGVDGLKDGER